MSFIPNTDQDKKEMMDFLGIDSIEELFSDIDASIRLNSPLKLPKPLSEMEITRHMRGMSASNASTSSHAYFLGAGAYDHYIPSAIAHLLSRGEFLTSYTPYQAEMSQGLLQSIF